MTKQLFEVQTTHLGTINWPSKPVEVGHLVFFTGTLEQCKKWTPRFPFWMSLKSCSTTIRPANEKLDVPKRDVSRWCSKN